MDTTSTHIPDLLIKSSLPVSYSNVWYLQCKCISMLFLRPVTLSVKSAYVMSRRFLGDADGQTNFAGYNVLSTTTGGWNVFVPHQGLGESCTTDTLIVGGFNYVQSGGGGDPHLTLAYGGMADFRGINDTFFSMLSAPGINAAVKTNDAVFMIKHNHRVAGSFMTEFAVNLMAGKDMVTVRTVADKVTGFHVTNEQGDVISRNGQWTNWTGDGVIAEQLMLTTSIRAHGWEVNATRKPVYNHVTGPKWRFDFTIRPLVSEASWTCYPHGIVGQSFDGTGIGLLGKMDDYDGYDIKTSAMAEGVIEGSAVDYIVKPTSPKFKYSRFYENSASSCKPRDANSLSGRRIRGSATPAAGASD